MKVARKKSRAIEPDDEPTCNPAKQGDAKPRRAVDEFPTDRSDIQLFQNFSGLRQIFYLSMLQTPSVTIA